MLKTNTIYNGDCLEVMKKIKDKSIDMILSDLPYKQTSYSWDCLVPTNELWEQYERIIKDNGAIVLTAKGDFMIDLIVSNRKLYRYEWIVNKRKGANFAHVRYRPLNVHEYALVFYKKKPVYNPQMVDGKPYTQKRAKQKVKGLADNMDRITTTSNGKRYPKSIIEVKGIAQRHIIHPNQKPVDLFEYLIKTYSNEGDKILDSCSGAMTTAVACDNNDREWICIEKELIHCSNGLNRVNLNRERLGILEKVVIS